MVRKKLGDTQQIKTNLAEDSIKEKSSSPKLGDTQSIRIKPKRWKSILLGFLIVTLFAAAGGGFGYLNGINQRLALEKEGVITQAALHYQYGLQQMAAGNYELARVQLEYVLQIYPEFPGITDKYTETMLKLGDSTTSNETILEPTPTMDVRGAETLFTQATQEIQNQQWEPAIKSLEALRDEDYTYRTIEVDGLYYTALRFRAIEYIVNEGNLEEGLYLLALLEKYAPLDHDAVNYANWARLYITGSSFWDINWGQVVNYFGQLSAAFPYMHDGTGWTATDRYLKGSEYYGDQLASEGKHCEAITQYQNVLNYSALEYIQEKYNGSYLICYPPTAVPLPTATEAPVLVPTDTPAPPPAPTATKTP
jgi:tetratricopeptide (TPR) repeat protein